MVYANFKQSTPNRKPMKHLWSRKNKGDIFGVNHTSLATPFVMSEQTKCISSREETQSESPILEPKVQDDATTYADIIEQPSEAKIPFSEFIVVSDGESTNSKSSTKDRTIKQSDMKSGETRNQMTENTDESLDKKRPENLHFVSHKTFFPSKCALVTLLNKSNMNVKESSTNGAESSIENSPTENVNLQFQVNYETQKELQKKRAMDDSRRKCQNKSSFAENSCLAKADTESMRTQLEVLLVNEQEYINKIASLERQAEQQQEAKLKFANEVHNKQAEGETKESNKMIKLLESFKKQCADLELKNKKLEADFLYAHNKSVSLTEKTEKLEKKVKESENIINQLTGNNKALIEQKGIKATNQTEAAYEELQEKEFVHKNCKTLRKNIAELKQETATLTSSLKIKESEQAFMISEFQKLKNLLENHQTKLNQVRSKLSWSRSNNYKLQQSYHKLKLENRKLEKLLISNQEDVETWSKMLKSMNSQLEQP